LNSFPIYLRFKPKAGSFRSWIDLPPQNYLCAQDCASFTHLMYPLLHQQHFSSIFSFPIPHRIPIFTSRFIISIRYHNPFYPLHEKSHHSTVYHPSIKSTVLISLFQRREAPRRIFLALAFYTDLLSPSHPCSRSFSMPTPRAECEPHFTNHIHDPRPRGSRNVDHVRAYVSPHRLTAVNRRAFFLYRQCCTRPRSSSITYVSTYVYSSFFPPRNFSR